MKTKHPTAVCTPKTGILIVNLGSPDDTSVSSVRRYLRQFLSDPRVIDIPALVRWFLLNLIILPLRPAKSAHAYRKIWDPKHGSPLKMYTARLAQKLQRRFDSEKIKVSWAMRYRSPSIESSIQSLMAQGMTELVVWPLFPQYSSAATGSAAEEVFRVLSKGWNIPGLRLIPAIFDDPRFIKLWATKTETILQQTGWKRGDAKYRVLISFHGLPLRHCIKSCARSGKEAVCGRQSNCCDRISNENCFCYRAQCVANAKAIAQELGLGANQWSIGFQSRLGSTPWIKPYTDKILKTWAKENVQHVVVISPSFVADCLETSEEIAIRAREDFVNNGGQSLTLVPSLNDDDEWVEVMEQIITSSTSSMVPFHS